MNEAYRPRRTCLSVPGSSQKMIDKAKHLPADEIFLDLEDAVAPDAKEAARTRVAEALAEPGWARGRLRGVRVNDWTSPWTHADLIEVVSADTFKRPIYAGNAIQTVQSGEAKKVITVRTASFQAAPEGGSASVETVKAAANPGLSSFVSEFLVLVGTFTRYEVAAAIATVGIILAAVYILWMYQRTMNGPTAEPVRGMRDLSRREVAVLAPILAIIVGLGFYPKPVLDVINPSVKQTLVQVHQQDPAPAVAQKGSHQ